MYVIKVYLMDFLITSSRVLTVVVENVAAANERGSHYLVGRLKPEEWEMNGKKHVKTRNALY